MGFFKIKGFHIFVYESPDKGLKKQPDDKFPFSWFYRPDTY